MKAAEDKRLILEEARAAAIAKGLLDPEAANLKNESDSKKRSIQTSLQIALQKGEIENTTDVENPRLLQII